MKEKGELAKNLVLFYKISGWIIGPILVAILAGKWLDEKYDKEPWLFLTSIGFAFIITCGGIVREALKAIKDIEEENNKK